MSAQPVDLDWTIDELSALTKVTVRTIRYYTSLGLLPTPERRGRMVHYDDRHLARLELIQSMQDQGLTLAGIEQHLSRLAADTPADQIELRRALVTSWTPIPAQAVDRADLEQRAGRPLSDHDLTTLERLGTIRAVEGTADDLYEPRPTFEVGVELLDLDIPMASIEAAGEAIRRHMDGLVLELREVLRSHVLAPLRQHGTDTDRFGRTMSKLQRLTVEAVVGNFQQAASRLVDGSLLDR